MNENTGTDALVGNVVDIRQHPRKAPVRIHDGPEDKVGDGGNSGGGLRRLARLCPAQDRQIGCIIGADGKPRLPETEEEACSVAIHAELMSQQLILGSKTPLVEYKPELSTVFVRVDIKKLLEAIKGALDQ